MKEKELKNKIAKYENWIRNIKSSINRLVTILTQEWMAKFNTEDIEEIIDKASELLVQFKPALKVEANNSMKKENNRLTLEENRREIEGYKATIEELIKQKNEVEVYNIKANEEIMSLVNRLKLEQEIQRQLNDDLVMIKEEIKEYRLSKHK